MNCFSAKSLVQNEKRLEIYYYRLYVNKIVKNYTQNLSYVLLNDKIKLSVIQSIIFYFYILELNSNFYENRINSIICVLFSDFF